MSHANGCEGSRACFCQFVKCNAVTGVFWTPGTGPKSYLLYGDFDIKINFDGREMHASVLRGTYAVMMVILAAAFKASCGKTAREAPAVAME